MQYEEITHKIIGCAMRVHNVLGNGFQEVIYQRALAIEMKKQNLPFQREMEMTIYYDGFDIGTRRVDFFVENKIIYHPWLLTVTFQIMSIGYNIDVVFRIFHFYQGGYHA
ncbi:MAG: GxxExxY protein, partial [Planctomycetaceae bacterium]|nr:GxxExxY protein [Planctomycetaceae bacterium]